MDVRGETESENNSSKPVAALDVLLERLAAERDVAPAYEQLRMRLVTFFRLRFPVEAETLADEAIDRLARRLKEGTQVENVTSYAVGIARFLVLEAGARHKKEHQAAREAMREFEPLEIEAESDAALLALRACLDSAGAESAQLILEYYAADGGAARIGRRQQLAERLGMTLNTLRNRALRTRMALEKCVRGRLEADSAKGGDVPSKRNTKNIMQYPYQQRMGDDAYE